MGEMKLPPEFNSWEEVWREHQLRGKKIRELSAQLAEQRTRSSHGEVRVVRRIPDDDVMAIQAELRHMKNHPRQYLAVVEPQAPSRPGEQRNGEPMTVEQWRDSRASMFRQHNEYESRLHAASESLVFPPKTDLRRATSVDIVEGAVIYYPSEDPFWMIVEEVLRPDDDFKAYTAHDGCRYGLHGAYVRK